MNLNWLTTELVEDIQHAVQQGQSVKSTIEQLQAVTLPAIMEYECLRWVKGEQRIPSLPNKVANSEIGKALRAVKSELGLQKIGPPKKPRRTIEPQPVEFMVVANSQELEANDWGIFEARFNRSAYSVDFTRSQADKLQGALFEMVENALIHAASPIPVLVGYRVLRGIAQFSVVDVGIGVLASLKSCPDYQHIQLHKDAIREALRDGTSCQGYGQGGLGFREVFKALTAEWGQLRFRSGEGCVMMDGTNCDADKGKEHFPPFLPGFQVTITCRTGKVFPSEPLL